MLVVRAKHGVSFVRALGYSINATPCGSMDHVNIGLGNGLLSHGTLKELVWGPTIGHSIFVLIHWGQVTHICVGNLTSIGSDDDLSPNWRHAIICTNAGILLIGHPKTNFSEISIKIHTFSLKKMHLKMSSGKWRPFFTASMCPSHPITPERTDSKWPIWF